jgi:hypothetical protein
MNVPKPQKVETRRADLRTAKAVFSIGFLAYLVFPNPGELNDLGIGSEGGRVLVLDVFLVLMVIFTASSYREAARQLVRRIGKIPLILFAGISTFSVIRGLPDYGGFAIGEARWYACILLMPAAYAIYDDSLCRVVKKLIYAAAIWHVLVVLYRILGHLPVDTGGDVMRYGKGRESLVIAVACILLIYELFRSTAGQGGKWQRAILLGVLLVTLIISQTRSIFLFLPGSLLLAAIVMGIVPFRRILYGALISSLLLVLLWSGFAYLMPEQFTKSVEESVGVVLESVSPETIGMLFSGELTSETRGNLGLSQSGNTAFRLLAWAQTIQSVSEAPGGTWIGAPMGSGFFFFDGSGAFYENLDPHNDYISIWSKVGWIGLATYLSILASFILAYRKAGKLWKMQVKRSAMLTILTVVILVLGFVGTSAEIRTYGTHFWIWVLLGFGFKSLDSVERKSSIAIPITSDEDPDRRSY